MITLMTSCAPPEPPLERKLIRFVFVVQLVVVVVAIVAALTRSRRRVRIPILGVASIWPWIAIIVSFLVTGGTPRGSDWIALLPVPVAFVLSFLGLTIGRDIAARRRSPAP